MQGKLLYPSVLPFSPLENGLNSNIYIIGLFQGLNELTKHLEKYTTLNNFSLSLLLPGGGFIDFPTPWGRDPLNLDLRLDCGEKSEGWDPGYLGCKDSMQVKT